MSISSILAKTFDRAAIDVGSGGVRLTVASVDAAKGKIVTILDEKRIPVIFYEDLSRNQGGRLGKEIMDRGIQAIQGAIAGAKGYNIDRMTIVGTSVFRNAINGKQYADRIQAETGVKVHIIDQDIEGGLGFLAAAAHSEYQPQDLIVWDIGKTVQWTLKKANGCFHVAKSDEGSGYFMDYIISSIKRRSIHESRTPNPISLYDANLASAHAVLLAEKLDPFLKDKLQHGSVHVFGVGSVFGRGLLPLIGGIPHFTIGELDKVVAGMIDKTDAELGGGDFACCELSNALFIQGFMRSLKIGCMEIIDVNNAHGALVYEPFWD